MTAKMQNLGRVRARLARLPALVKGGVAPVLAAEADALADAIRRAVPVDTGRLRNSIRVEASGDRELSWIVKAGGKATTKKVRAEVRGDDFRKAFEAGADFLGDAAANRGEYDYAAGVEFGHRTAKVSGQSQGHVRARPFFYPTYRARKKGMRRRLQAAARKAAKQT